MEKVLIETKSYVSAEDRLATSEKRQKWHDMFVRSIRALPRRPVGYAPRVPGAKPRYYRQEGGKVLADVYAPDAHIGKNTVVYGQLGNGVIIGRSSSIDGRISDNVKIGDRVDIDKEAVVEESANIGNDVYIARKSRIGRGAVIGEGVVIGALEWIEAGKDMFSTSRLEREGAAIGEGAVIGRGAVIKAGARIPKNTVVKEGETVKAEPDIKEKMQYAPRPDVRRFIEMKRFG